LVVRRPRRARAEEASGVIANAYLRTARSGSGPSSRAVRRGLPRARSVLTHQRLLRRRGKQATDACHPHLVGLFALALIEATHVLQPDRTRPGPQEQRIGAGPLGRHDNRGLRLAIRRPAEEPELLGEFVELEVGEDTDQLDLVRRFALSSSVALGPASRPRAVPERLVECSKVTFQGCGPPSPPAVRDVAPGPDLSRTGSTPPL
jgi:hypothetical protein